MKNLFILFYFSLFIFHFSLLNGQYYIIHNFKDSGIIHNANGADPVTGPLVLAGKKIFGTTARGSAFQDGSVFSLDTTGNNYKDLLDFHITNGMYPVAGLILAGKTLYGLTDEGGTYLYGCIFSLDTNGNNYKDLLDFNGTDGMYPGGNVLVLSGKTLYGTTYEGGAYHFGCLFAIDTNGGSYRDLHDFDTTTGSYPWGTLSLAKGVLYGMTSGGGTTKHGVLFSIDTNGNNYKVLFDFNGINGNRPAATFPLIKGKTIYAMTEYGGVNGVGNFFSIDTNGNNFKDAFDFSTSTGTYPGASFVQIANTLYGTAYYGGAYNFGCIFSIDTSGANYTDLFDFDGPNGKCPVCTLTLSGNTLYGITQWGGANDSGVVFKYVLNTETGVNKLADGSGQWSVFPNPTSGAFTLQANGQQLMANGIEVLNIYGQTIYQSKIISANTEINLEEQAAGIYFYRVVSENGNEIGAGKIVIEK